MAGRFITFEGGEGAGKSTQLKRLAEFLEGRGIAVVSTREPGGTPRAEAIRDALLSGKVQKLGPEAELVAFAAARVDHIDRLIRPALRAGKWVLCDRFTDSTRAYQGAADGVDMNLIRFLEKISVGETRPNLTIILDVPVEVGLQRAAARRSAATKGKGKAKGKAKAKAKVEGETETGADRFEASESDLHERRRKAFLDIARQEPLRCVVLSADRGEEEIAGDIREVVEERLLATAG